MLGALVIGASAAASPPRITSVWPPGAQRGREITIVIEGRGFDGEPQLVVDLSPPPRRVDDDGSLKPGPGRVAFRLAVRADEPRALLPLRVRTREGISEPVLFRLGSLPEVDEVEPAVPQSAPQLLAPPVAVNGRLSAADVDAFRLVAMAGERLCIEAEARRLGSAVDPTLRLLDAAGRELALGEDAQGLDVDCRIDHTFAAAGEYRLELRDAAYLERSPGFYRLRLSRCAYADAVFPPGGRAGEELEAAFEGGCLRAPVRARLRLDVAPIEPWIWASLPPAMDAGDAFPMRLAVGALPETREGARTPEAALPLAIGTVMNGRLEAPDEADVYALALSPGKKYSAQLEAAALGSWLDGVIEVTRQGGARIAAADDEGRSADPRCLFAAPEDDGAVRVAVRDLLGRGGPAFGYRLVVEPERPDFELRLSRSAFAVPAGETAALEVDCSRRSGGGTVTLRVRSLPAGIEARCGEIAADQERGWITLTAAPGLAPAGFELIVDGVMEEGGERRVRPALATVSLASDQGAPICPWTTGRLAGAIAAPASVALASSRGPIDLVPGSTTELPVEVRVAEGGPGELVLRVAAPPGITAEEVNLAPELPGSATTARLLLAAAPKAALREGDLLVTATYKLGGDETTAAAPLARVRVVPPFAVELAAARWAAGPGAATSVRGRIVRAAPFAGAVRIELRGLPEGARCAPLEVPADKEAFELSVELPRGAATGTIEASLVASCALGQGNAAATHARPPVKVVLDVATVATPGGSSP